MSSVANGLKSLYYGVLHIITAGKGISRNISGFRVSFPTRYYKYYEADYEKESFSFIRSKVKEGDIVLDIGGHIGLYATAFGQLVGKSGRVYSFEPTPSTRSVLSQTVSLNHLENIVSVQPEAIAKERGETTFYISDNLTDNSNSLVDFRDNQTSRGIKVPLISIDDFATTIGHINFIKIDVEGAEYEALLGAKNTLVNHKPTCILALHPKQIQSNGNSLADIWDVVKQYGYQVLFDGAAITKEVFCSKQDLFDVHLLPVN